MNVYLQVNIDIHIDIILSNLAGDHVKFNFPMAFSVTELAWSLLQFKDAYADAGQLDLMIDSIRWPLDYLLRCHVSPNVLYGQVLIRALFCSLHYTIYVLA